MGRFVIQAKIQLTCLARVPSISLWGPHSVEAVSCHFSLYLGLLSSIGTRQSMNEINPILSLSLSFPLSSSSSPVSLSDLLAIVAHLSELHWSESNTVRHRASLSPFPRASSLCLYQWYQSIRSFDLVRPKKLDHWCPEQDAFSIRGCYEG